MRKGGRRMDIKILLEELEVYPHHHAKFDFDEKVMLIAVKIFISAIANFHTSGLNE